MATDTPRVEPTLETPATPAAAIETPAAATPAVETPAVETPAVEPPATPAIPAPRPVEDWRDRRIATLTARLREAEAKNRATPVVETPATPATPPANMVPASEVDRRAQDLANASRAQQVWLDMTNSIVAAGQAQHQDWDSKVREAVTKLVPQDDPAVMQAYTSLVTVAHETGKGHEILYNLSQDHNEFARLLALPPLKMAVEVARMVDPQGQVISKTPKPIKPIGVNGARHEQIAADDPERADNLTTAEWMRRREAQVADRGKTRH